MELIAQKDLGTFGASVTLFYQDKFIVVRQNNLLLKINAATLETLEQYDFQYIYSNQLCGLLNDSFVEFGPKFTRCVNLDSFQVLNLGALDFNYSHQYKFTQIQQDLIILQKNSLLQLNLKTKKIYPLANFAFEVSGQLFLKGQNELCVVSDISDELTVVNVKSGSVQQRALPINAGYGSALFLAENQFLLLGHIDAKTQLFQINLLNSSIQELRSFHSSITQAKYSLLKQQFALTDSDGILYIFKGAIFQQAFQVMQKSVETPQEPKQISMQQQASKYEIFALLLQKYIINYQNENERQKCDKNLLSTCNCIMELIRVSGSQIPSKEVKKHFQQQITQATRDFNNKQLLLQEDIQAKQQQLRELTEKLCVIQSQANNIQQAELELAQQELILKKNNEQQQVDLDLKKYKEEQESKLNDEMRKLKKQRDMKKMKEDEEWKRKQQDELLLQQKKKLEQERQQLEELKKQQALLKQQKQDDKKNVEMFGLRKQSTTNKLIDKEEQKKLKEEEQKLEEEMRKIKLEEEKILFQQKQEELKKQQQQELERMEREKQRKAEQSKEQFNNKQIKGIQLNSYQLLSTGASVVFIINSQELILRQGHYLMLVNFLTYRVKQMASVDYYNKNTVVSYFNNVYTEYAVKPFSVDARTFEIHHFEETYSAEEHFRDSVDFVQNGRKLYIITENALFVYDIAESKITRRKDGKFQKVSFTDKLLLSSSEACYEGESATKSDQSQLVGKSNVQFIQNKFISFQENKIYKDGQLINTGISNVDTSKACSVGNVCIFCNEAGYLTTLIVD